MRPRPATVWWGQSEAFKGMLNFGNCKGHFLEGGIVCVSYFFLYFYPSFAFDNDYFFWRLYCFEEGLISWYGVVVLHPKKGWILVLRSVLSFITKVASGPQLMWITGKLQNCIWTRLHPHPRPLLHFTFTTSCHCKILVFQYKCDGLVAVQTCQTLMVVSEASPRTCQPSRYTLGGFCTACAWFTESRVNQESPEVSAHCYTLAAGPQWGRYSKNKKAPARVNVLERLKWSLLINTLCN